jgi:hypothetical protein
MPLNLIVQLGIMTAPAEQSAQAGKEHPEQHHGWESNMPVRIATVRAQVSVSPASCFFPAWRSRSTARGGCSDSRS